MLFPKSKSIEAGFRQVRLFCLLVVGCNTLLCGYMIWRLLNTVQAAERKVYILSSGKALEALAGDRKDNLPAEARDHIRVFHTWFFSLEPDEQVIRNNISRALYLADGSARRFYENLRESGYYTGIVSGNISQQLTVDSIALNLDSYPWYFRCYATQRIIRLSSIVTRDLVTEGWLRNVIRSDNNPHGFLIERWNTLENRDLRTEAR